jgi:hypothetical protein
LRLTRHRSLIEINSNAECRQREIPIMVARLCRAMRAGT